jgi:hypothetical protein
MTRLTGGNSASGVLVASLLMLALCGSSFQQPAAAQAPAKAPARQVPAKKLPPATAKAAAPASPAISVEPATPEAAAKVLDLRSFPLIEGAKVSDRRTLGMLMYEAPAAPQAAFEFQRRELTRRGFEELAGGYRSEDTNSGHFRKDGFTVAVSSSRAFDAAKAGWSSVTLVNGGNVDLQKLPVPPGAKPFHPQPAEASYTTELSPAAAAEACRKLLAAAGWEPYGQTAADPNQGGSSMSYFKRNTMKIQSWVMTTPADGGKTLIRYSAELLSADLPAPPFIPDPAYTDAQKTLRFDAPTNQTDAILAFYQKRLPKMGWKATTDKPISDDRTKSQFVVYRNPAQELLSLDLTQFSDIVRVKLAHQTEAEVAAEGRRAKEEVEKQRLAAAERDKKVAISVPLPAGASKPETLSERAFEFQLATGSGPQALAALREHFAKDGWSEEPGTLLDKNTGRLDMKQDGRTLSFSYFDTGFLPAEVKVSGSPNLVLEAVAASSRPPSASQQPPAAAAPKPSKQATPPSIPGLPALPPGVAIPDDVKSLVEKALQDAAKPPAKGKKP